jgi:hypothetical protein
MSKKNFNIRINYILSVFLSFMITLSFFTAQVNAQNQPSEIKQPTEAQLTKIQTECSSIKSHLKKLRSNDALMRVNLGQNYETISSRLMAKLNARIATNKLNGSKLVEKSAEFNENMGYFRENYQTYEKELVKLVDMDCQKTPKDFYIQLERVRYYRKELNFNTTKLSEIAKEYEDALIIFKNEELK